MSVVLSYGSWSTSTLKQPVPDITFNTSFNTTPAGKLIGSTLNISLNGLLFASGTLNDTGNYSNQGTTTAFMTLLTLVTGFVDSFSKDYQTLTLQCGSDDILLDTINSNNVRVNSFNLTPNGNDPNMLRSIQYSADLVVETTGGMKYMTDSEYYVSNIQNSYSVENLENLSYYGNASATSTHYPELSGAYYPTYRITRTLGATGKATQSGALYNAKRCVSGLIANDVLYTSVLNNLTIFERSTSIEFSEPDGRYTITDNCTAISGSSPPDYTETFTINNSMDDTLKRTVTINGTIQGLGKTWTSTWDHLRPGTSIEMTGFYKKPAISKYASASGAFDSIKSKLYNRVLACVFPTGINDKSPPYSGSSNFSSWSGLINPTPLSINVEHDPNRGLINYTYTYDTRPVSLVSGALNENLSVEDSYGVRSYAKMDILKKRPLFQELGTYSSYTRTATYDASFPADQRATASSNDATISDILNQFDPSKAHPSNAGSPCVSGILTKDDSSLDVQSGKYTRSKSWIYQKYRKRTTP